MGDREAINQGCWNGSSYYCSDGIDHREISNGDQPVWNSRNLGLGLVDERVESQI